MIIMSFALRGSVRLSALFCLQTRQMAAFPVDEAQLLSLFFESVAYGIYLVTFGMCLRALLWSTAPGQPRRYNWPSIIMAGAMFVCATLDTVFNLRHNLAAFIFYKGPAVPRRISNICRTGSTSGRCVLQALRFPPEAWLTRFSALDDESADHVVDRRWHSRP